MHDVCLFNKFIFIFITSKLVSGFVIKIVVIFHSLKRKKISSYLHCKLMNSIQSQFFECFKTKKPLLIQILDMYNLVKQSFFINVKRCYIFFSWQSKLTLFLIVSLIIIYFSNIEQSNCRTVLLSDSRSVFEPIL